MKTQKTAVTGEGNAPRMSDGSVMNAESVKRQNKGWANSVQGQMIARRVGRKAYDALLAQRNELLAALKELRRAYKDTTSCASDYAIAFVAAQRHADAAIANVERGGAAMNEVNEELEGNNPVRWCHECEEWIEQPCEHEQRAI